MKKLFRFGAVVLLVAAGMPVFAQTVSSDDQKVNLEQVRQVRDQAERSTTLSDEIRTRVFELCDGAIESLEIATDNEIAAGAFERERAGVDRLVENLRADLEKPEPLPHLQLPENPTVAQAEDALARERARLTANRSALRDQERLAEDRAQARTDISKRLGELDLILEVTNNELRAQVGSPARSEIKVAARLNTLARRKAALSEAEMLRGKLALFVDRSVLIPLEIDLAQRRVSFSEESLAMLERAAHELRVKEAEDSLGRIRDKSARISEQIPTLAPLMAQTESLANELWSHDGLLARSESTVAGLAKTRHNQAELNRIAELTSRKFEAFGHRGSIQRWWPDLPQDFPDPGVVASTIRHLDEEIPAVEHRLITFEQQRSAARQLARETMFDLQAEFGDGLDPKLAQDLRDLFSVRQDLLDQLIQKGERYSNQLAEYRSVLGNFHAHLQEVERFLYSHVLWSRSVPKPIIPRLRDIGNAMAWLVSPEHLKSISILDYQFTGKALAAAVFLIFIIFIRRPMLRRMKMVAEPIDDPERDSLRNTIEAVAITVVLAAPLPLVFYIAGTVMKHAGSSTYLLSMASAFFKLAVVAAFFELIRRISAPFGLAEAHFGWPTQATRPLNRGVVWTEVLSLPLLFVALHLGFAGMRLDSPHFLQVYNNSLGRVAFVAALALFGLTVLAMLRPVRHLDSSEESVRILWPKRFSEYAFPSAFLGAYPIILLSTILPAILAIFGFYLTGLLLAYQMLRSLILALVVMVVGGLFHRQRIVARNRKLNESVEKDDEEERGREMVAAEKQVRKLFQFVVITVLAIGLYGIWSEALPWLQILKRVQVLPRIELLEPIDNSGSSIIKTSAGQGMIPVVETESETAPTTGADPAPDLGSTESPSVADQMRSATSLTLWRLIEAILVGLLTLVLVNNMPGLIEIVLKRRTTLDGGARFAFTTLIRYLITIIGTTAVFGLLGVTWSKVQWLAAALTFGLGFGLQEIVANFVSGLILLVERPVRVGDVVTIGTLMGRVNRIQIRATTITLWDRSEMIVPNKEFITTKLVNWTLSDSKRRIEIPLRVAYGTDLEKIREILVNIAKQHPSVLADPAPHALLLEFGDDAIKFELRFVVDFGLGLTTKDQVQMSIEKAFKNEGIQFALPKSEVRLISGPEPATNES